MKKIFVAVILLFSVCALAAQEVAPLNLQLEPNFDKDFQCVWRTKTPMKVWVGFIQDNRVEKDVGHLVIKDQETPLYSARPVTEILEESLQKGLTKCGYQVTLDKQGADLWVTGGLEEFTGVSKKGVLKGKAEGRVEFTLNLREPKNNQAITVSFELEEAQEKAISKKPKKLQKILNNLLTRLTLNVFDSRQVAEWLKNQ